MKKLLMVAFHFPPLTGSSGIHRTLRFVQHLPEYGWEPIVLTADPRAYEQTSRDLNEDVPPTVEVCRAFALDTSRHLSLGGRYLRWMARPDRWMTWRYDAVRQGSRLVRERGPVALWSTYPIATAHLIGAELQRRSGLPWIADFRDPMAQEGYPADPQVRSTFLRIEETAAQRAALCVFASPGALREYQRRYPYASGRMMLLENGYDEASFATAEAAPDCNLPLNAGKITLLHSGIVYPDDRNPEALFGAVQSLIAAGRLAPDLIRLRFRAAVHEPFIRQLAEANRVDRIVEILPALSYGDAIKEMLRADALLVMQGNDCNYQVPAKVYEYLRAGRPVLCLADPSGDTAQVCREADQDDIAALEDRDDISACLAKFVDKLRLGRVTPARPAAIQTASRRARSAQLGKWLDALT